MSAVTEQHDCYEQWEKLVDAAVQMQVGVSLHDLADMPLRDWYDAGMLPGEAAAEALAEEGFEPTEDDYDDDELYGVRRNVEVSTVVTCVTRFSERTEIVRIERTFGEWMREVVKAADMLVGRGVENLPEMPYEDMHANGLTPEQAAKEALFELDDEGDYDDDELYGGEDGESEFAADNDIWDQDVYDVYDELDY